MTKREAIIQATIDQIAEKGMAEAPTVTIAKRAGTAELTLFRLFGSKANLLHEAYEETRKRFFDVCLPLGSGNQDIEDRLRNLLKLGIAYYREHPEELAFVVRYGFSPAGERHLPENRENVEGDLSNFPLVAMLVQGQQQGIFRELPMSVLIGLIVYPIIMLIRGEHNSNTRHSDQVLDQVIEACIRAVKT